MSSQSDLTELCRSVLADDAPVDYDWTDTQIVEFLNRALRSIYPALYRVVVNEEIWLRYDTLTYDLSAFYPPIKGLIGVWLITSDGDYFIRRHYTYDPGLVKLTFNPGFYYSILRDTASANQTTEHLGVVYRSFFSPFSEANQECELDSPDEELLVLKVEELALRKLRNQMIKGRVRRSTETWNEFDRIILSATRSFNDLLGQKRMVGHGGYPSTNRRKLQTARVRMG